MTVSPKFHLKNIWEVDSHLSDDVEEVRRGGDGPDLGLDVLYELVREDLDHGLGGQLVHGVVLVPPAGQVGELLPGKLVDALDHARELDLERSEGEGSLNACMLLLLLIHLS